MKRLNTYRQQLFDANFKEATHNPNHFYRTATAKTAFIINLKDLDDDKVGIVYGFCSTAFMSGDELWFEQQGESDDDCNLRFYIEVCSDAGEILAKSNILQCYYEYCSTGKDALLNVVKERRKQFLAQITDVLRPLGFRKNGNKWRRQITENNILQFWADKNSYTDLYYFEVDIFSTTSMEGIGCFTERLKTQGTDKFDWKSSATVESLFDWQLQPKSDLLEIIDNAVQNYLLPFINSNLDGMGKKPFVWERCICTRDHCETCWVQKNLWEAKE